MAKLCEPVKIIKNTAKTKTPTSKPVGNVLEIRCEGVYAALLQHQTDPILARVNLFLGSGTIGRIRLIQGQISTNTPSPITYTAKPLSAQQDLALQQQLSEIKDERLRLTLLKLGRAVYQKNPPS